MIENEHVDGRDAPPVYLDDATGAWVFRASSLGGCPRALVEHRLGHPAEPVPASMLTKFDEGKAAEPVILKILQAKYGWEPIADWQKERHGPLAEDGQVMVQLPVGPAVVCAHPDDIMVRTKAEPGEDEPWQVGHVAVVEVKALSESMFKQWEAAGPQFMGSYEWQLAVQMHATGLPGLHVVGVKGDDGKVLADRVYVHHQLRPTKSFGDIAIRALGVLRDADAIEAGERRLDDVDCEKCWPCGFWTRAGNACAKREADELDHETETRACSIALAYTQAREREAKAKGEAEEMRNAMVELLGKTARTVRAGGFEVCVTVPEKGSVSWQRVAKDFMPEGTDIEPYRGKPRGPSITVNKKD